MGKTYCVYNTEYFLLLIHAFIPPAVSTVVTCARREDAEILDFVKLESNSLENVKFRNVFNFFMLDQCAEFFCSFK